MKKYFIMALLLHGMLFLNLSLSIVTKNLDNEDNFVKQNVPVTFTQIKKSTTFQSTAEVSTSKEVSKKEKIKSVPEKIIPKKTESKKEIIKKSEIEVKETSKPIETTTNSSSDNKSAIPSIDSLFTANSDGTYNAISNHGIKYKIIKEIAPTYPKQAENIRYKKKVIVIARFLVDYSGNVKNISIINSHRKLGFDQAVIDVLEKWKFSPIIYNGKPIEVYFQKEFIFEPNS